ncbi:MAG: hypothetical protein AAF667_12290 [Pseudomonadota bacterium]
MGHSAQGDAQANPDLSLMGAALRGDHQPMKQKVLAYSLGLMAFLGTHAEAADRCQALFEEALYVRMVWEMGPYRSMDVLDMTDELSGWFAERISDASLAQRRAEVVVAYVGRHKGDSGAPVYQKIKADCQAGIV